MYKVELKDGREVSCDQVKCLYSMVQTYLNQQRRNGIPGDKVLVLQQTFKPSEIKSITPKEK